MPIAAETPTPINMAYKGTEKVQAKPEALATKETTQPKKLPKINFNEHYTATIYAIKSGKYYQTF
jgi:hypothetical protein